MKILLRIISLLPSKINFCLLVLQSDKASMLDEAIEYLKSLQLQVQVHFTGLFDPLFWLEPFRFLHS